MQTSGRQALDSGESPLQRNYPVPENFVVLAKRLRPDAIHVLLNYVWRGYDRLRQTDRFDVTQDDAHIEDEITVALHARIQDLMHQADPFSPFAVVHQPVEVEKQRRKGRPPQSDLGFRIHGGNVRSYFSIEAKVLRTDGAVSAYVQELTVNFLSGRYSRFSTEAAMLGYLLAGRTAKALDEIASALLCVLSKSPAFPTREHRCSRHTRNLGTVSTTAAEFVCHHLLLDFGSMILAGNRVNSVK